MDHATLPCTLRENAQEMFATSGYARAVSDSQDDAAQLEKLGTHIAELVEDGRDLSPRLEAYASSIGGDSSEHVHTVMLRVLDYVTAVERLTATRDGLLATHHDAERFWTDELQAGLLSVAEQYDEHYQALSAKRARQIEIENEMAAYAREIVDAGADLDVELEAASAEDLAKLQDA